MFRQVICLWFLLYTIGFPVIAHSSNDNPKVAEGFNGKIIVASNQQNKEVKEKHIGFRHSTNPVWVGI